MIAAHAGHEKRTEVETRESRGGCSLHAVSRGPYRRWTSTQTTLQPWKRLGKTSLAISIDAI